MTVDKRRTDACLKACEGISTQNLEDNVPFLELARRYNVVLRERDALRAKIEQMEKQEPVAWARELGMDLPSLGCVTDLKYRPSDIPESAYIPLYALPGAQGEQS